MVSDRAWDKKNAKGNGQFHVWYSTEHAAASKSRKTKREAPNESGESNQHQRKESKTKTDKIMQARGSKCQHQRRRNSCRDCTGGSICHDLWRRSDCKDCGGGSISWSASKIVQAC